MRILAELRRKRRLAPCLLPVLLAVAFDALVLAPWMLDRADMEVYLSRQFLEVKHWSATPLPARLQDLPGFVVGWAGPAVVAAALMLAGWSVKQAIDRRVGKSARPAISLPKQRYLLAVVALATALVVSAMFETGVMLVPWMKPVFQLACYATLLWFWREQWLAPSAADSNGSGQHVAVMLGAGLGVFLCLMSFGPVYATNPSPLATNFARVLLSIVTPLKSIQGIPANRHVRRAGPVGFCHGAPGPRNARRGVERATGRGRHHRRDRAIQRVPAPGRFSGYRGAKRIRRSRLEIPGPWRDLCAPLHEMEFDVGRADHCDRERAQTSDRQRLSGNLAAVVLYASKVLHRFPDAEAVWLLRKWNVETVVSLAGDVGAEQAEAAHKTFANAYGVVWDSTSPGPWPHTPQSGMRAACKGARGLTRPGRGRLAMNPAR